MNQKYLNNTDKRVQVSAGESVQIVRALQGLGIAELAKASGIPSETLAAIESDRIVPGKSLAKRLARALKCKPEVFSL